MKKPWLWFTRLFSGKPHFYIGGTVNPYMLRWHIIPRNPWLNVYLHKFLRDDDDRALHDHPWWFISMILKGQYIEWTRKDGNPFLLPKLRRIGSIVFRSATTRHCVTLTDGTPCWTLVITGRKTREWGFWCPKGFVPWFEFVDQNDEGNVGKGCGE